MEELRLQLSELYVAYFGRAPDADGLAYWAAEMDGGIMSYDDIAANWSSEQQEFTDIYGEDVSNDDFIAQVYQNVLGRVPDADGLAYWSGEMSSGTLTTKNMVQAVVAGAKASTGDANDALLLNNKAQAGVKVADSGINDIGFAQKAVAAVTKDASTLQIVKDLVDMAKESSAALAETLNTLTAVKELIDANASDATASAAVLANLAVVIENVAASNTSGAITDISSTLTAVTATVTAAKTDASFIANPETLATSIATDPTAVEENAADVVEEAATPTPPSSSSSSGGSSTPKTPTFMVKDTDGVITFGGTATGDISVAWADTVGDSLATFTRGGKTATADITATDKITVASGQTLADTAADLAGLKIDGAGTVNVTALEDTLDADLSGITADTVTAAMTGLVGEDAVPQFTGDLGNAALTLTGSADFLNGSPTIGADASFVINASSYISLSAANASSKTITGDGSLSLFTLASDTDTTNFASSLTITDIVTTSKDVSSFTNLSTIDGFNVHSGQTLTLSAAQAEGKSLSGEGSVTVKDIAADTNLSTITATGTLSATVTSTVDLTSANLTGLDTLSVTDEAETAITVTVTPEQYAALVGKVTLGANDRLVSTDTTIPTSTITSAAFDENTGTFTLTGTNFDTILETTEDATTDVKARLDWSKLSWDINGDDNSTTNVSFAASDITSAKVTNATTLTITLTSTKAAALLKTAGYGAAGTADTIDITAEFIRDMSHNAATTDALADAAITIIEDDTATTTTISAIDISADTGTSDSDFITKTASQTITATLSAELIAGDIVYGSVDNGSTWTNITDKVSGTAISWDGATLSGESAIVLKVSDAAGNDGATDTQAYTLDTTAPTVSAISVTSPTTINLTSNEASIAGIYTVSQTLIGSTATMVAGTPNTITVEEQETLGNPELPAEDNYTYLVVSDTAGNTSTPVNVVLGTSGDDAFNFYGTDETDIIFGFGGSDWFVSGAGNDTLYGGAGVDTFVFTSENFTKDDIINGGEADALNSIYITDAATIIDEDFTNVTDVGQISLTSGLTHSITLGTNASLAFTYTGVTNKLGIGIMNGETATSLTVDASAVTIGITVDNKPNSGDAGATVVTGGSGDDIFIFGTTGASTVHFAASATDNGMDKIYIAEAANNVTLDFSNFINVDANTVAVDFTSGLDLTSNNLGIVFNKATLSFDDIATSTAENKIAVSDNGKAVVFCADVTDTSTADTSWGIYYIEDTNTGTEAQTWEVTLVGQVYADGTGATATEIGTITFA